MLIPIFFGEIKEGKLRFFDPDKLSIWLSKLNNKEIQVTIERKKKDRSIHQNAYYWKIVVGILSEHFGYFKDEFHEILKWKFLRIVKDNGLETVKSTTRLSTKEMEDYLSKIRMWASSEFQIFIPEPNEKMFWT